MDTSISYSASVFIRQRKVNMALMILQAQLTTVAKAIEGLQLTWRPKLTKPRNQRNQIFTKPYKIYSQITGSILSQ